MKQIYYGEILKELPVDRESTLIGSFLCNFSMDRVKDALTNPDKYIWTVLSHDSFKQILEKEQEYIQNVGDEVQINHVQCKILEKKYDPINDVIHYYTNFKLDTIPMDIQEYEKVKQKVVDAAEYKLKLINEFAETKEKRSFWGSLFG